ncbi:MAG: tRNA (5-methylaminomethyl-2-thiouridine)(34)-methyltransferase MnmD, partial [Pseudomonadota bacterium]
MLEWRDGTLPVSTRFDDPYYSVEDGRAETSHVFIEGNHLPQRWQTMHHCTVAELGFGTGLNFLETVLQWQNHSTSGARLDFFSFERFPLTAQDMLKALSAWSNLNDLTTRLTSIWEPNEQKFEIEFLPDIRLKVHFADANASLPNQSFEADAWYLDGFSPAKNPELWNAELMKAVADHTVAGGTFSTYTAAGFVRRNLAASGFIVTKSRGYGRKREMLIGEKPRDIDVA